MDNPPQPPEDKELNDILMPLKLYASSGLRAAYPEQCVSDVKAALIRREKRVKAEAEKATASKIFNLAHEYAQQDKTMVSSGNLRDYHYYNAIHRIGGFSDR